MIIYKDEVFGFFEIFNEENGTLFRSDINGVDPVMRSFPELLDVGIMGHCNGGQYCRNAGIDCYQKGFTTYAPHMSYENFMEIVKQAAGKTFQIALGGAGDPNKHPQIEDILKSCRAYRIIPNMTTSGFLITDNEVGLIKQYCGAVAVSWYSRFMDGKESNQETIDAVERLVKSGCTTNIHYVVSKDTINEAITRLEMDSFPKGVNAVIFILYKPVGNGIIEKVLKNTDSRIERFISLATKVKHPYRVGFDTCFTPALLRWGDTVPAVSMKKHSRQCACDRKAYEEEQKYFKDKEHRELVSRNTSICFDESRMEEWTFENADMSDAVMHKAKRYVDNWEEMKRNHIGCLFWGPVGTGKSFIAGCIANELLKQEVMVKMTNFNTIIDDIFPLADKTEYINALASYQLLIIDDLGVERNSEYALGIIFSVIDRRIRSGRPLIITTNLPLIEIKSETMLDKRRIYDRILEMCTPMYVGGTSKREVIASMKMEKAKTLLNTNRGKEECE